MLELKKIKKVYKTGTFVQHALKGVSLNFRECEFASILGPSGSGKTTLLNIIGGLDNYTSGDLRINEVSTKNFKGKDWDSYRNHRIGFVFQSYNLIPHQTILKNVSLALTISGVSRTEALKRAKKALKDVGLGDHIMKRPAQLSGGQMQRVAIARALVNDPDILLADEPTGALDSETSLQIMDILKNIAKTKLVIMVTHNPELAEEYSNRIITLKDGQITSDTNPYDGSVNTKDSAESEQNKQKKTKMSLLTSMSLSVNNLLTKKARTILVAIAGSIGIIGIALILAVSNGFQRYIDTIEEETMTSYPLMISSETSDITGALLSVATDNDKSEEKTENTLTESQVVTNMLGSLSSNDLTSFKSHLESHKSDYEKDVSNIIYNYGIDPLIYTYDVTGKLTRLNPSNIFTSMIGGSSLISSYSSYTSIYSQLDNYSDEFVEKNYKILAGHFPEKSNELVVMLGSEDKISDLLLYSLGLRDSKELETMVKSVMAGEAIEVKHDKMTVSYDDLLNIKLKLISPTDLYRYNGEYDIFEDMSGDSAFMANLYERSEPLNIVGIVTAKDSSGISIGRTGIGYLPSLITDIIEKSGKTDIVKKQLENPEINVISGKRFDEESNSLGLDFANFVSVDSDKLSSAFNINISQSDLENLTKNYLMSISTDIATDVAPASEAIGAVIKDSLSELFASLDGKEYHKSEIDTIVSDYLGTYAPSKRFADLEAEYVVPVSAYQTITKSVLSTALTGYIKVYEIYASIAVPGFEQDPDDPFAVVSSEPVTDLLDTMLASEVFKVAFTSFGKTMTEAKVQKSVLTKVGSLVGEISMKFAESFNVDPNAIRDAFRLNVTESEITRIISAMMTSSDSTADTNLTSLGYRDLDSPALIYFYFTDFDGKEHFLDFIDAYNNSATEDHKIKYTDTTGLLLSSVKTIVDAVTYVLIAFVSISLVVSSIMIGVITYISVYERTKEIGILRAIGASKHDVSSIFNVETFIIGLLSGIIAMAFSSIAIPIINAILVSLTDIESLTAYLSLENALLLIILSIILTIIGGFIPSKSAAKKDPVEALRTE